MKKTLHVDDPQAAVRVRGGRCEVIRDEQQVASVPLKLIDCVLVQTASELPLHALQHLLQAGARVVLLDGVGRCVGRLEPVVRHLPERLLAQCAASADPSLRLGVARRIVSAKLHNQAVLLRDRSRRTEVEAVLRRANGQIGALAQRCTTAADRQVLRGFEGAAGRVYFDALRQDAFGSHGFDRRDRRGGDGPNAMINYTSALLREEVIGALLRVGLHPGFSLYHEPRRDLPALAFDLMEEFRPALLEPTVLAVLGLGAAASADLTREQTSGRHLTARTRRALAARFRHRLHGRARTAADEPARTYHEVVLGQARRLAQAIRTGEPDRYVGYRWR